MAVQGSRNEDKITPYLDPNQQDLLLAALNAQAQDKSGQAKQNANMSGNALFMSPQDAQLDNLDYTPDLDYLDGDNSFDFDNADLGGEMIGALPARTSLDEGHEKRKSRDEGDAADEGDAKRQETQDGERTGKKPGRKPLTNEPTTVRLFSAEGGVDILTSPLETESTESRGTARLPRAQREASQRSRDQGVRTQQDT